MINVPCLPLIQERFYNAIKDKENFNIKYYPDFEMYMFPQTWGDTSLGFGGIGGQAITSAYTTVVIDNTSGWCGVFFDEGLAYTIHNPNENFFEDLKKWSMKSVSKKGYYIRKGE